MANKHNARRVQVDGTWFASKNESQIYLLLKDKAEKGEIRDLVLQPKYELQASFKRNGKTIRKIEYIADFQFVQDGKMVVVDAKSPSTEKDKAYRIKRKMFLNRYGDEVVFREMYANGKVVEY